MRQRQRHFLGRSEAVLAVENHAVAAIQHQDRGAGTLVLALVDVQVRVLQIERHLGALAADGGEQRGADIQIQRVAELVALAGTVGLDAGGEVARIVAPEAAAAERAQQILQRLEAQKIERFVGDLELHLGVRAGARAAGGRVRGILDADLPLVHHLLDQVVEQLLHLLRRQLLQALHHLLHGVVIEQLAALQRLLNGLLEIFQRVLVPLAAGMYGLLKPLCSRKSESAFSRSSASTPKSSPV